MQAPASKVFHQTATGDKAKQLEKAAIACRAALKTAPRNPTYMHVLGLIECQLGRLSSGKKWLEKALAVAPNAIDVQNHYGLVLMEQEKYAEAILTFRRVIALEPAQVESHYHLGKALHKSGQSAEAEAAYRQALALKPGAADALNDLGNLLNDQGKFAEAIDCYRRAIAAKPDYAMPYNNMGLALVTLGELDGAEKLYRQALALKPDYPEALNNLGIVFRLRGQFDESIAWYKKALALRPDFADALNNLGNALKDRGEMDEAIACYRESVRLKPTPDHHQNLALALLSAGRLEEGWREYEWRGKTRQHSSASRAFAQPQWKGEAAGGRTLLIHSEQGFGDTLQFCRYAPLVKARGLRVIVEAQAPLARLIGALEGVDQVIAHGQELPDFDLHCPMLSLPFAFGTALETIPASIPYLKPPADAVDAFRARMPGANGALRVGLVWAGRNGRFSSPDLAAADRQRSIAPELLAPLMNVPGVQFYSLQKLGPAAPDHFPLIDLMKDCADFADTAALIANLDLVISVDTAVAHLAAALGKTVWVMNRFNSCWRWLQNRDDSPWYPSLRLFRQPKPGDWKSVIARVRASLEKTAGDHDSDLISSASLRHHA